MAERIKDAEDRLLESLFTSEPIADQGFSDRALRRVRRQVWVRRLTLPIAVLVGGAIALKPATQLVAVIPTLLGILPQDVVAIPTVTLPQLPVILLGGALLVIGALTARMLEE